MVYAAKSDIIALYGDAILYIADRDGDGVAEDAAIDRALEDASDLIDSHIGVRYQLPLPSAPRVLVQTAVDIAIYKLALTRDVQTEEHRTRFDDATALLKRLAEGKASLNLADTDPDSTEFDAPQPIVTAGPPRLFSREKMRDL